MIIRILTNLTSKDFVDFSSDGIKIICELTSLGDGIHAEIMVKTKSDLNVPNTIFSGLNVVLPLISVELLKVSNIFIPNE